MSIFTTGSSNPELYATTSAKRAAGSEGLRYFEETGSRTAKSQVEKARERHKESQALTRSHSAGQLLDPNILQQACELLENIDPADPVAATVNLTEVGSVVASLWESAESTSPVHCEILAALDTGILAALAIGNISADHISAFREALGDLSLKTVSEVQAEAIRSRFIDLGNLPLFIVSSMDEIDVAESGPNPTASNATR